MSCAAKMLRAKRNENHEKKEATDSRTKRSRLSSTKSATPSSPGSADEDDILQIGEKFESYGVSLKEDDLEESKTLILKIGPATNSSYEDKYGPRFKDFGGIEEIIRNLTDNVVTPLRRRLMPVTFGVGPLSGIILHGPSGCGKTTLAKAIGNETGLPFHMISAADVISGGSGTSMKRIIEEAHHTSPSILFIDDLHAIGAQDDRLHKIRSKRIKKMMIACMDRSVQALHAMNSNPSEDLSQERSGYVLVIGATNQLDSLEPELRSLGYFDRELHLAAPDERERKEILSVFLEKTKLDDAVDLSKIAGITRGFVGADLLALVDKARELTISRFISQIEREVPYEERKKWWWDTWPPEINQRFCFTMADFEEAAKLIQPST